jgi:phosphoribosylanthranilate isomerase
MTLVKICGITDAHDGEAAVAAGADMLGFNFYSGSARYISPEDARDISSRLAATVRKVGVFVNATAAQVRKVMQTVGLDMLQFHGDEDAVFCRGWELPVIKAIRVRDQAAAAHAAQYGCDFILADAFVEGVYGGSGTRVATELLNGFDRRRLILAGGLRADNVEEAVRSVRPYAVDVASGVESAPGKKDADLMRRFVAHVHAA